MSCRVFTDYRPGDRVQVSEPDGTTFEGPVSRVGRPWGMMVRTSYDRNVPVAFSHAQMVEPNVADYPLHERWAHDGEA